MIPIAARRFSQAGNWSIAAAASGPVAQWSAGQRLEQFPTADFATLADRAGRGSLVLLDVRRLGEWLVSHIEGAVHVPLHELAARADELPAGEVWVHCAAGYRAAVAASMLAARGRKVVAINDDFSAAGLAGLTLGRG